MKVHLILSILRNGGIALGCNCSVRSLQLGRIFEDAGAFFGTIRDALIEEWSEDGIWFCNSFS